MEWRRQERVRSGEMDFAEEASPPPRISLLQLPANPRLPVLQLTEL